MKSDKIGWYRRINLFLIWTLAVICILFLDLKGLWGDEAYRLFLMNGGRSYGDQLVAKDFASFESILVAMGPSQYQPLYFLLGNLLFRLIGHVSEIPLRLINVLFLFGGAAGMVRLFRHWPPANRLMLFWLFAFNGFLILNIFQIREYPLYLLLSIYSTVIYFDLFEANLKDSGYRFWGKWLIYVILGILGFYTHAYFVFLLVAQAVFVLWRNEDRRQFVLRMGAAFAAMLLGALPWILFIAKRFPWRLDPGAYTAGAPQTVPYLLERMAVGFRCLLSYNDSFSAALNRPFEIRVFLDIYAILVVAGVLLALRHAFSRMRETDPRIWFALFSILVFTGYQSAYFFLKDTMSTWTRYFIGNYLGMIILAAFAFKWYLEVLETKPEEVRRGRTRLIIFVAWIAGCLQLYNYYRYPFVDTPLKPDFSWDDAGVKLSSFVRPADTIVYYNPLQGWAFLRTFKIPAAETHFWTIQHGKPPETPVVWFLDTRVDVASLAEASAVMEKNGYRKSPPVNLGLWSNLIRFDRGPVPVPIESQVAPPGPGSIVFEAEATTGGNAVGEKTFYGVGIGVLTSASVPVSAEYVVQIPKAGKYEVRARYATASPRPVTLTVGGLPVSNTLGAVATGGFVPANQKWSSAGYVELGAGPVKVKLESTGPLPHFDKIAFVPGPK
jgi:uncharacterized membrane protein